MTWEKRTNKVQRISARSCDKKVRSQNKVSAMLVTSSNCDKKVRFERKRTNMVQIICIY